MTLETPPPNASPAWSSTIKLVVGLTFTGVVAVLLIYYRFIIGPLLMAFILTYLLHPLAARLCSITKLSWRASANIIFLTLIILLLGFSTLAGLAIIQQIQSLIEVVKRFVNDLPTILQNLPTQIIVLGIYQIDLSQFLDLSTLSDQLINALQLLIGRAGTLVSTFATGAANTIGWGLFVLLVAYFLLADAGRVPDAIDYVEIPGYDADVRRMGQELGRIWNSFLRGQLVIVLLVMMVYSLLMTILGIRYAIGIAILAGIARFVPYLGQFTTLMVTFLVTFLQGSNYFNLAPVYYAALAIGVVLVIEQVFDNYVSPRVMGQTLGVHPAAVLVGAIVAANLIGIVGLVLAAPVVATMKLIGRYIGRKMFDLDPWSQQADTYRRTVDIPLIGRLVRRVRAWLRTQQASRRVK